VPPSQGRRTDYHNRQQYGCSNCIPGSKRLLDDKGRCCLAGAGHLIFVPSETGASYGDLDEQYLTASYRVYLSEADAKKVFAYIKHIRETSPLWNAATTNCTAFLGRIATFMGLKAPFHLLKPEEYVNQLRELNGGRKTVQLEPDQG
jgi:hypothetical protein